MLDKRPNMCYPYLNNGERVYVRQVECNDCDTKEEADTLAIFAASCICNRTDHRRERLTCEVRQVSVEDRNCRAQCREGDGSDGGWHTRARILSARCGA